MWKNFCHFVRNEIFLAVNFLVTAFYYVHFNRHFSSKINIIAGSFNFAKRKFFATCFISEYFCPTIFLSGVSVTKIMVTFTRKCAICKKFKVTGLGEIYVHNSMVSKNFQQQSLEEKWHKVMHIMYLSMSCPTYHTPGICGARVGIDLTISVVVFPAPRAAGAMSQILVEFCAIQATIVELHIEAHDWVTTKQ